LSSNEAQRFFDLLFHGIVWPVRRELRVDSVVEMLLAARIFGARFTVNSSSAARARRNCELRLPRATPRAAQDAAGNRKESAVQAAAPSVKFITTGT
jgi:hypothetical protein